MQRQLDQKSYSATQQEEETILKSIFYSGKFQNHIRVSTLDDLTQTVYSYIKQSYNLL